MARGGTGLAPVAESERILTLDVVRGFALLGILLMNVEFFNRPLAELESGMAVGGTALDQGIAWFVHVFVRGKFWTLISLLFGMGFAVMLERAQARGTGFAWPYLRRALALGAIGAAHFILLWAGDILFCYAAGAVLLLLAARWFWRPGTPVSRLRTVGLVVYLLPFVLATAAAGAMLLAPASAGGGQAASAMAARAAAASAETAVMTHGSFVEAVAFRADAFVQHLGGNLAFAVIATGMFLFGA